MKNVTPKTNIELPPLSISVKTELSKNNFPDFEKLLKEKINSYDYELISDSDFTQAGKDLKSLKEIELKLEESLDGILRGSTELSTLIDSVEKMKSYTKNMRLDRKRRVETRKVERKNEIVLTAIEKIDDEYYLEYFSILIREEISGMRSYDKMEEKLSEFVTSLNDKSTLLALLVNKLINDHGNDVQYDLLDLIKLEPEEIESEVNKIAEEHIAFKERLLKEAKEEEAKVEEKISLEPVEGVDYVVKTEEEDPFSSGASVASASSLIPPPEVQANLKEYVELLLGGIHLARDWKERNLHSLHPDDQERLLGFSGGMNELFKKFF